MPPVESMGAGPENFQRGLNGGFLGDGDPGKVHGQSPGSRGRLGRRAAWHLPGGPLDPPAEWAAT